MSLHHFTFRTLSERLGTFRHIPTYSDILRLTFSNPFHLVPSRSISLHLAPSRSISFHLVPSHSISFQQIRTWLKILTSFSCSKACSAIKCFGTSWNLLEPLGTFFEHAWDVLQHSAHSDIFGHIRTWLKRLIIIQRF